MAGQFDTGGIGDSVGASFTPRQAVVDTTASIALDSLGKAVNVATKIQASRKAKSGLTAIDRFSEQQVLLADAVDQGKLTSGQARSKARQNFIKAQADNPGLGQELIDVHGKILREAGLGKVIQTGTDEEQLRTKLTEEATVAGWVKPSDSAEQKRLSEDSYFSFKRARDEHTAATNELSLASSQDSHAQSVAQQRSKDAALKLSGILTPQIGRELTDITQRFKNGAMDQVTALAEIQAMQVATLQQTAQTGARAGGNFVENLQVPMSMLFENSIAEVSGTKDVKLIEDQNKMLTLMSTNSLLKDESVRNLSAIAGIFRNSTSVDVLANSKAQEMVKKFVVDKKVVPEVTGDTEDVALGLSVIRDNLIQANKGNLSDGELSEFKKGMQKTLKSIDVYQSAVSDPSDYNDSLEFFASTEYGDYSLAEGGIDTELSTVAKQVIDVQYNQEVIPLLRTEYERVITTAFKSVPVQGPTGAAVALIPRTTDLTTVVEPVFNGAGVTFRSTQGNNSAIRSAAKGLNEKVAPVINRMIRSSAHFEGNKNYKAQFDVYFTRIFGAADTSGSTDTQEGD